MLSIVNTFFILLSLILPQLFQNLTRIRLSITTSLILNQSNHFLLHRKSIYIRIFSFHLSSISPPNIPNITLKLSLLKYHFFKHHFYT
jgi:hypothetical protein